MRALSCLFLALCLPLAVAGSARVTPEWADKWREDLEFVRTELPDKHADLFHSLTPEAFDASLDDLRDRIPSLSHHEIIVELAAVVAAVGDGHTRLTLPMDPASGFFMGHSNTPEPNHPAMGFHYYPLELYLYEDGLFVRRIGRDWADWAGARVLGIGGMTAERALEAVDRVIHRDNGLQVKNLAPAYLAIPEVLHALGMVEDTQAAKFTLVTTEGHKESLTFSPVEAGAGVDWVDAAGGEAPLYLQDRHNKFWFTYLEEANLVYCQYNEVYPKDDETIASFAQRLRASMEKRQAETLVVDLRFNSGGNNSLNLPFLHELIRCQALQEPGSLFVITGRGTFSAAMMFAMDLERHTSAIFVGEPTGARPNHYGDSRKLQLPHSGITIRASSLYWQYGDPRDERDWIAPHLPAPLAFEDYRQGRDPALEAILEVSRGEGYVDTSPQGDWSGRLLEYAFVLHLSRTEEGWQATVDLPDYGAMGIPLSNVSVEGSRLSFDFPNGDGVIGFEGVLYGNRIVGRADLEGQVHPWGASR